MSCCTHDRPLADDPRFEDDESGMAALRERRVRAAHAHGLALLLGLLGGLLLHAVARKHARSCR